MSDYIPAPTMGEILREEFMEQMNLSAYKLAQEIHVTVSRIQAILNSGRGITADTSLRLAKFSGVSDRYFLDMQNDIDICNVKKRIDKEIEDIKTFQATDWKSAGHREQSKNLNKEAIIRRLNRIVYHYKKANEANELEFSLDVNMVIR